MPCTLAPLLVCKTYPRATCISEATFDTKISWWTAIWLSRRLILAQFCTQFFLSRYGAERRSRLWLQLSTLQLAGGSAENCHPCVTMCHNKIVMKQYRTCQEGFRKAISHFVFYAYRQRTVAFITGAAFLLSSAGIVLCCCSSWTHPRCAVL